MTDIKFYVNGDIIDYFRREDFSIKINKKIIDNEDPSSRSGTFTYTIKLPLSQTNRRVFNFIDIDASIDKFNTTLEYNAIIYANDIIIIKGRLYIKSVDNEKREINCYIISEEIQWANILSNKSLNEIQSLKSIPFNGGKSVFDNIDDYYDNSLLTVPSRFNTLSDIVFPFVQYANPRTWNLYRDGRLISNQHYYTSNIDGTITLPDAWKNPELGTDIYVGTSGNRNYLSNSHISFEEQPPSVYLVNVVRAIFADIGYSVSGSFFNKENVNKLVIPYTGDSPAPFNWNYLSRIKLNTQFQYYIQNQAPSLYWSFALDYKAPVLPNTPPCFNNTITIINPNNTEEYFFTYDFRSFSLVSRNIADIHIIDLFKYFHNYTANTIPIQNYSFAYLPNSDTYVPPVDGNYRLSVDVDLLLYNGIYTDPYYFALSAVPATAANENFKISFAIIEGEKLDEVLFVPANINTVNIGNATIKETFRYTFSERGNVVAYRDFVIPYNPLIDGCYTKGLNETFTIECALEMGKSYKVVMVYAPIYGSGIGTGSGIGQKELNIKLNHLNLELNCIDFTEELEPSKFLPKIGQLDFIKELITLFNLRFDVNNDNKVISFDTFDEYFLPIETAINLNEQCNSDNIIISPIRDLSNSKFLYNEDTDDYLAKHRSLNDSTSVILNDYYDLISTKIKDKVIKNEIFTPTTYTNVSIFNGDSINNNNPADIVLTPFNLELFYKAFINISDTFSVPFLSTEESYFEVQNNVQNTNYDFSPRILMLSDIKELNGFYRMLRWNEAFSSITFLTMERYISTKFRDDIVQSSTDVNDVQSLSWDGVNGLFNKYYKNQITEINRSHIVEVNVYITPSIFVQLSTKRPVLINGIHYRLNEIVDYDPVLNTLTTLKLTRIV